MTQLINKNPIVSAQGKAAKIRKRAETRSVFKTLLLAEAILLALSFCELCGSQNDSDSPNGAALPNSRAMPLDPQRANPNRKELSRSQP